MYNVQFPKLGIELAVDRVAFTVFGMDVYWYGVLIALGAMLGIAVSFNLAKRRGIDQDKYIDVLMIGAIGAIVCARAYYVAFAPFKYDSFIDMINIRDGGLAIYGGVIGAFDSGAIICKLRKVNILNMFDIASVGFLIGQGIGRWGNFVNQEAYGGFTGSNWWGMQSDRTISEMGEGIVHPCFLYESIWCLAGFFILNHFSKKRKFSGQIVLMYCAWYGFGRGFIELLRTDSLMIGNIKVSALLSYLLCITAVALLVFLFKRSKETVGEDSYSQVFVEQLELSEENEEIAAPQDTEEITENDTVVLEDDKNETD